MDKAKEQSQRKHKTKFEAMELEVLVKSRQTVVFWSYRKEISLLPGEVQCRKLSVTQNNKLANKSALSSQRSKLHTDNRYVAIIF